MPGRAENSHILKIKATTDQPLVEYAPLLAVLAEFCTHGNAASISDAQLRMQLYRIRRMSHPQPSQGRYDLPVEVISSALLLTGNGSARLFVLNYIDTRTQIPCTAIKQSGEGKWGCPGNARELSRSNPLCF